MVHYIINQCGDPEKLGATKLNKILWFLDSSYYYLHGKAVTEANYIKLQHGPVPENIMYVKEFLQEEKKIVIRKSEAAYYIPEYLISLQEPDLSLFNAEEISIADKFIYNICNNHTASSISELSHDEIWQLAEHGEPIPLFTVFAQRTGELTPTDVEWGKQVVARIRATHA